ncbi:hypothetical protein [Nocardia tengchongensis]|uniref:hypothetical protein n=1 Tax=Nocardia tengchongensis TaxID=2055889 RepID=UPI0036BAF974
MIFRYHGRWPEIGCRAAALAHRPRLRDAAAWPVPRVAIPAACARKSDRTDAKAALARADSFDVTARRTPEESLAYFCTPGHIARMRGKALRLIGDLPAAIGAARESLQLQAVRDRAASQILLGTILTDPGDLDAGRSSILDGAEAGAASASARLSVRLIDARGLVHVRAPGLAAAGELDARIEELQLV